MYQVFWETLYVNYIIYSLPQLYEFFKLFYNHSVDKEGKLGEVK